ncbi:MAG: hypothetical protein A6F72_04930 [Cycloclasticus sp. symbiont of Poecilosclerida sp. N]|nr:MAG: hypothetical protein A6F72_04930 [Cycloclasticus sp. symbiont of Poecilosclerida sp. N]
MNYFKVANSMINYNLSIYFVIFLIGFLPIQSYAQSNTQVEIGVGALWLDLPESTPFVEVNGAEEVLGFIDNYDTTDKAAPLLTFSIDNNTDTSHINFSGFFSQLNTRDSKEYSGDRGSWTTTAETCGVPFGDGIPQCLSDAISANPDNFRLLGWVGAIDGSALRGTPNFAWGDPIHITTKRNMKFFGMDLTSKALTRKQGISIGPSYQRLIQKTDIYAYESNRKPDVNYTSLTEKLDASYYGGAIKIDSDIELNQSIRFSAKGSLGFYYLDSKYRGTQLTYLSASALDPDITINPAITVNPDLNINDDRFALTAQLNMLVSYAYSEDIDFNINAGIRYLSHVPYIRYVDKGAVLEGGSTHNPAYIDYKHALGYQISWSANWRF